MLPELLLVLGRTLSLGFRLRRKRAPLERDRYLDKVQGRRLRGRKRRLTVTMRRSMVVCRLAAVR